MYRKEVQIRIMPPQEKRALMALRHLRQQHSDRGGNSSLRAHRPLFTLTLTGPLQSVRRALNNVHKLQLALQREEINRRWDARTRVAKGKKR